MKDVTEPRALVLSGGGALGAAHIGCVQELRKARMRFDWYGGVSAGAIMAACLAAGLNEKEIWERVTETKLLSLAFDFSCGGISLIRGMRVRRALERVLGDRTFESLPYPLTIFATDFATGELCALKTGRVLDAVRASISVPGIFEPVFDTMQNRWLVDGGLSCNLPVEYACSDYPTGEILGIDVATAIKSPELWQIKKGVFRQPKAFLKSLNQSIRILLLSQQLGRAPHPRVSILRPPLTDFSAFDVFKLAQIKACGAEAAIQWMSEHAAGNEDPDAFL